MTVAERSRRRVGQEDKRLEVGLHYLYAWSQEEERPGAAVVWCGTHVETLVAPMSGSVWRTIGGVVCEFQERMAKSGSGKYAFFKLEDQFGQVEFMVGNNGLTEFREVLVSGEPLLVNGRVDAPYGEGETVRERVRFLSARALVPTP